MIGRRKPGPLAGLRHGCHELEDLSLCARVWNGAPSICLLIRYSTRGFESKRSRQLIRNIISQVGSVVWLRAISTELANARQLLAKHRIEYASTAYICFH